MEWNEIGIRNEMRWDRMADILDRRETCEQEEEEEEEEEEE
jgi:hypothetical protein